LSEKDQTITQPLSSGIYNYSYDYDGERDDFSHTDI